MPKVFSVYICLAVISIDFVCKNTKVIIDECLEKNINTLKKKKGE